VKHYLHVTAGVPDEVRRRLPRTLTTVDGSTVCHQPDQVEENGDLHLYGWYVFDSTPATVTDDDRELPLLLSDVSWDGTTASATHRQEPIPRRQRRIARLAELKALWAAADWTSGPAWTTYKNALRTQMAGLIANTIAPKDVVIPPLPGNVEIP
jgi:hypothetical protein